MIPSGWGDPPVELNLPDGMVHVWLADLTMHQDAIDSLWLLLSEDEKFRADRFHKLEDRAIFIVRRSYLRRILGRYLHTDPALIDLRYDLTGKPFLGDWFAREPIHFSLSHSAGKGLFAFSRGFRIGVDIEKIREDLDVLELADQVFSMKEKIELQSIRAQDRIIAFYRGWTSKEALLKGVGWGFSRHSDWFDIRLSPSSPLRILEIRNPLISPEAWSLEELPAGSHFVAVIAVERRDYSLCTFRFGG